jgi:hypothetical protein
VDYLFFSLELTVEDELDNPMLLDLLPIDKKNLSPMNNPVILMIDENSLSAH